MFTIARRLVQVFVALCLLVIILAIAVHTPPLRRAALSRAIAILQDRLNIRLQANSLEYNLLRLHVELSGVDLSSVTTPHVPFLHADTLTVDLPWSALYGQFSIDRVALENARVHILRYRNGTSNLPPSRASTREPAPIPIGRIVIPRLAIEVSDEPNDVTYLLPALAVDVGPRNGVLRLLNPGSIRRGNERTEIKRLDGPVSFDGRAVRLESLMLTTTEASARIHGTILVFAAQPRLDLQLRGTADVGRAARWGMSEPTPTGTMSFDGTAKGVFSALKLALQVESDALAWQRLTASNVKSAIELDAKRLRVADLRAAFAGGRVVVDVDVAFEHDVIALTGSWTGLDAGALVRALAPRATIIPAGRASGTVSMRGTGTELTRWNIVAQNQMVAGRAAPNQLPVSGTARLQTTEGKWRLTATQRIAEAPVRADVGGQLSGRQLAASSLRGQLIVEETDLARLLEVLATADIVRGPPAVTGLLRADVDLSGTLDSPYFKIAALTEELSAGGVKNVTADVSAMGSIQSLDVDAQVRQDPGNLVSLTGTIFPEERRLDVRAAGRLEDPARLAELPIAGVVDLEFDGAGPFDAIAGRGKVTIADLVYDQSRLGRLESTVELDPTTAHVNASLPDFNATAEARVAIAAPHETAIDVQLAKADLARVVRDQKLPTPLIGLVSLTGHATGPLDDWRRGTATLDVSELDARAGDLPLRLISPAQATYGEGIARVTSFEATVGETHVSLAGDLRVLDQAADVAVSDALRATLTGDVAQALSAVRAIGLVDVPPVAGRGPLALLARVTGSAMEPLLAADLELGPGSLAFADWPEATNVHLRAHLAEEGTLKVDEARGEWQGSRIVADGLLPIGMLEPYVPAALGHRLPPARDTATLNLKAELTQRALEPFVDAGTVAQLDGTANATLHLSASSLTPDAVEGELRLDSFELRASNLRLTQREPTLIVVKDGVVRVATWEWVGDGTKLEVRGDVRLKDEQVSINAGGPVDLRLLSPFVRNAGLTTAGTLESLISITGPLRDPHVAGQVALSSGEVRLADPRIVATDLNGTAVLSQTRGEIPALAGTVNGGPLTGRGHIEYGPNPLSIEFTTGIRNMALNFPEGLRSELNVDLTLKLAEDTTTDTVGGSLSGDVTVLRGSYREPLAVVNALLSRLRTGRVAAAAAMPGPETFAERLALNIRVTTDEDVSVDNNYGRLALGGDLRVIGTAAAPSVSGRATLREGGRLFIGRNVFTIQEGSIDFTNPETIEPNMDIVARTRVSGREIELNIAGTPGNLRVEPEAVDDPDLSVADAWSLLLTGRTLDQVRGDERRIVGEQVLGYVSGDVLGVASRAVGIDTIRLGALDETALLLRSDPTILGTRVDPTSRLTFGQSIGEKVDVTFSQNLRDGDSQTWVVDYQPGYKVVLRFVSDDQNLRAYQVGHEIEIGEATTEGAIVSRPQRQEAKVTSITIDGNLVLSEARVRDRLRVTVGDTFDFEDWQRDRDRLEELYREQGYREARIDARRTESGQGITLSYHIEAGARTTIEVSGLRLPRKTIEAVEEAWNGSVFDGFLIDDATRIVQQALLEEGYLQADVKVAVALNGDVKTLSISITPGGRTTEFQVRIESKDEELARDLDRWLDENDLDTLAWRDRAALVSALTNEMRARGYLRAQVTVGVPLFEGRIARLPVAVDPGPVFRVSEITLEGARTLFDAATNAVAIEPGALYDAATAEAARDRVAAAYRRDGFGQVRVTVRPDVNAEKQQVALVFQIVEGPRQLLQEVSVIGIRGVNQDVVTRALRLKTGDPIGTDTWLEARTRIFETGLFRRVDLTVEPVETAQADDPVVPMRMQITVEEWPQLRLRYAFAVAEEFRTDDLSSRELVPGLAGDVTRRTLFGRPIAVGMAVQLQRRQELGRVFATSPTFFSLPIASQFTVQRSREDFADATLTTDRSGFSWEQQFLFIRRLNLLYSYTFERDHTFDTDPPLGAPIVFDETVNVARLTGTAAYDTRDNVIDSTRGFLLSSTFDYAPEAGGSDFRFVRNLGQAYYFRPWRGVVLAWAARLGLANGLAGQELIPSERFFAGGATSLRGVGQDLLGPLNFRGDPTGGEGLLLFNQEFRFPIYRWFRGVAFNDAGNVFVKPSDISLGKLRGSLGLGLRVVTRFALLRVDYGRVLSPQTSQERSGIWTFGIGQIF